MADEKENGSPSADETVDSTAADTDVADDNAPEQTDDGAMDGVGGIFDVPSSKKRKKKKKKKASSDAGERGTDGSTSAEDSSEEEAQETTGSKDAGSDEQKTQEEAAADKKKSTNSDLNSLGGVFDPSSSNGGDVDDLDLGGDYLGEDDLDGYEKGSNTTVVALSLVVVVLLGAFGFVLVEFTDVGADVAALFRGELKERRMAEAQREKEEWEEAQQAKLEKYGTLNVTGKPVYSLIKLDGQTQYGQTSDGAWRELRLSTSGAVFQNLKVKKDHTIEAEAPGFQPEKIDLSEGMWEGGSSGPYSYSKALNVNLLPESGQHQLEFEQRMDTSDVDEDYYGEVTINSMPAGAEITFNNKPLLDEDGEELVTPVTFDTFYVEDEDTGKLEEEQINVDTPPDRGHKIELKLPEEEGEYPEYVNALQRRMWTCEWKDGEPPATPPNGKTFRDLCNYTFNLELDFNGLKSYIERREAEKKRIEEENAELRAAQAAEAEAEEE